MNTNRLLSPLVVLALAWAAVRADEPPPAADPAAAAPAPAIAPVAEAPAPPAAAPAAVPAVEAPAAAPVSQVDRQEAVAVGSAVKIAANERAPAAVAVWGDVTVDGRVDENAVAVWGDVVVTGKVGENAVVVFGNARIDGPVDENLVCVFGTVELGPKARIGQNLVIVAGALVNPHRVPVGEQTVIIGADTSGFSDGLRWVRDGLLRGRLLVPGIAWPWLVYAGFLAFYLLVALLFRGGVNACARTLEDRPGGTLLTSIVLVPLAPLGVLLLSIVTLGIGTPFIFIAMTFAKVFGHVAFLAFLGRAHLRMFGADKQMESAVLTTLIGGALIAVLYCVPFLGLLVFGLSGWLGFGMAVYAVVLNRRKEKAAAKALRPVQPAASAPALGRPSAVPAPIPVAAASMAPAADAPPPADGATPTASNGFVGGAAATMAADAAAPASPGPAPAAALVSAPPAASLPRADFWVRLAALAIDLAMIVGLMVWIPFLPPFPLLFGLYVGAMWAWKGTSIGGIICNLKIVRLDDRPVDPATAIVRTLVGYLSVFAVGLGFLWCIWDPEQQTWHDKVAGTVVVRVPKGTPLV